METENQFVDWLLASDIPTIRFLTLVKLNRLPISHPDVLATMVDMRNVGPIPMILRNQTSTGSWIGEKSYYTPKYTSTHWSMLLLEELRADTKHHWLLRGVDFMLDRTEDEAKEHVENKQHGLECFWGNVLRYSIAFGSPEDPRLINITRILVENALQAGWRCPYNDDNPCAWGVVRTLWGLAVLPSGMFPEPRKSAIEAGVQFLLGKNRLITADYPVRDTGGVHPLWKRMNFPLFYQADILFVLRTLKEVGALDQPGAGAAINWLLERRGMDGRWRGASPFRSRTWKEMGDRNETNRWVSLQAALILEDHP